MKTEYLKTKTKKKHYRVIIFVYDSANNTFPLPYQNLLSKLIRVIISWYGNNLQQWKVQIPIFFSCKMDYRVPLLDAILAIICECIANHLNNEEEEFLITGAGEGPIYGYLTLTNADEVRCARDMITDLYSISGVEVNVEFQRIMIPNMYSVRIRKIIITPDAGRPFVRLILNAISRLINENANGFLFSTDVLFGEEEIEADDFDIVQFREQLYQFMTAIFKSPIQRAVLRQLPPKLQFCESPIYMKKLEQVNAAMYFVASEFSINVFVEDFFHQFCFMPMRFRGQVSKYKYINEVGEICRN